VGVLLACILKSLPGESVERILKLTKYDMGLSSLAEWYHGVPAGAKFKYTYVIYFI